MEKEYLVIAHNGYWGRGDTLAEACKNACIGGNKRVKANIYATPKIALKDHMHCTGAGGTSWQWSEKIFSPDWHKDIPDEADTLLYVLKSAVSIHEGVYITCTSKDKVTIATK